LKLASKQYGFTLVELAVALAIAVLLMCGVLSVFTSIARDRHRLLTLNHAIGSEREQISELLTSDLSGASFVSTGAGQSITFQTNHSLDSAMSVMDRPSAVTYFVSDSDGSHCLYRQQQLLDEVVSPEPSMNLIASGVQKIGVEELQALSAMPIAQLRGVIPITCRRIHIEIDFDDPASKIDRIVTLP
jgi:prepilin-type N-terminal cleavage/methylation domain-containing protein